MIQWLHFTNYYKKYLQNFKYSGYNGLFQKKTNTGVGGRWGLRTYFSEPPSWNFLFIYFTPGNSRQNKAPALEIVQNCVTSLENFKTKNQDPWKFHIIFSWSPLEIPHTSAKFHILNPLLFVFFLEQTGVKRVYIFFSFNFGSYFIHL